MNCDGRAARRARMRCERWKLAKHGPLPFAIFAVGELYRFIHTMNPAGLLLRGLAAVQEAAERKTLVLSGNRSGAIQSAQLTLLCWLTGERDIEGEAPALAVALGELKPISSPNALVGGLTSRRHPAIPDWSPRPTPRSRRPDQEDQQPIEHLHQTPGLPVEGLSPASSAQNAQPTFVSPVVVGHEANPNAEAAQPLSETFK